MHVDDGELLSGVPGWSTEPEEYGFLQVVVFVGCQWNGDPEVGLSDDGRQGL